MATTTEAQRSQPPVNRADDSTQRGCTTWLLISCVVLTVTTAFVFGWGLGAPNMYNDYTEPFLRGRDPCAASAEARANRAQQNEPAAAVPPTIVNNDDAPAAVIPDNSPAVDDNGMVIAKLDADGNEIDEDTGVSPTESKPADEPFRFVPELIKGIPQTVFLIGAFIGAVTGPFWSKLLDRKRTVSANYIFCFASSLCVLLAYYFVQPWLFYLSRLLLGYQGKKRIAIDSVVFSKGRFDF